MNLFAEIPLPKLRIFAYLASHKALAQRTEWYEADAKFLERGDHFHFRFSPPQRVFALQCGDRLDFVGAADRLHARFRESEVLHLALLDQIFYRSRSVFDGDVGVDAVLIEQIDDVGLEALERGFCDLLDVLWPAVEPGLFVGGRINFEAELGGDYHLLAERCESFADEFFVSEWAVDFSSIEEGDAAFYCRVDERDHFFSVGKWSERKAHSHAAEADGGDFKIAFSEFAFLHGFFLNE